MSLHVGSGGISKAFVGSASVSKIYKGSTIVWPNLPNMGIIKSGSWSGPSSSNTWTDVPSMIVDPSYPLTVISSNKMVSNGSASVNIQASIGWTGTLATKQVGVTVNGALVWSLSGGSFYSGVTAGNFNWDLMTDDVVGLQANTSNSARGDIGASDTFLRWTVL